MPNFAHWRAQQQCVGQAGRQLFPDSDAASVQITTSEKEDLRRMEARIAYLNALGEPAPGRTIPWNRKRMDRIIADYLMRCEQENRSHSTICLFYILEASLVHTCPCCKPGPNLPCRNGYTETAHELAVQHGLADITDTHLFDEAQAIAKSLMQGDCSLALEFCAQNRSRLKKARSRLEFRLRCDTFCPHSKIGQMSYPVFGGTRSCDGIVVAADDPRVVTQWNDPDRATCRTQEFIDMARRGKNAEAIAHARKHMAPVAKDHMAEFKRALSALVFGPHTDCARYK